MNRSDKWKVDISNYHDEFALERKIENTGYHELKLKRLFTTSIIAGIILFAGYGVLITFAVLVSNSGDNLNSQRILIIALALVVIGLSINIYNFAHILFTNWLENKREQNKFKVGMLGSLCPWVYLWFCHKNYASYQRN